MNQKARVFSLLAVVVLLLSAVGCGGATGRSALYGTWDWNANDSAMTWEFKSDGAFVLEQSGVTIETKYEFVDDDTIKIIAPADIDGEDMILDFKVDGDNLTLSANGVDQLLTRHK